MKAHYYAFKNRMVSVLIFRTIYEISSTIVIFFLFSLFTNIAIAHPKYTIIPYPQELRWTDSNFTVNSDSIIVIGDNPKEKDLVGVKILQEEIRQLLDIDLSILHASNLSQIKRKNIIVIGEPSLNSLSREICSKRGLKVGEVSPGPEGYVLKVHKDFILVAGYDQSGTFYGIQTLVQLLNETDKRYITVPGVRIRDWPDMKLRGMHLGFRVVKSPTNISLVKAIIKNILARYKYNTVVMEVEEGLLFESHPELSTPKGLTKNQMKEIVEFAKQHFLAVIPEIQSLGHCGYWLFRKDTKYLNLAENPKKPYNYDPSKPAIYELLFDLYNEVIEIFEPEYFHIGHDEVATTLGTSSTAKGREPWEWFVYDVTKLHDFFAERGIKTMMWGDMLLYLKNMDASRGGPPMNIYKALDKIPKDIIICDWHYAPRKSYPSLNYFQERGFQVIAVPWYKKENIFYFAKEAVRGDALGIIGSTWGGNTLLSEGVQREQFNGLLLTAEYAWTSNRPSLNVKGYSVKEQLRKQLQGQRK